MELYNLPNLFSSGHFSLNFLSIRDLSFSVSEKLSAKEWLNYNYWKEKLQNNKRLQESIKVITDLIDSDIQTSKGSIFSRYRNHLDCIRFLTGKVIKK